VMLERIAANNAVREARTWTLTLEPRNKDAVQQIKQLYGDA
jgi:hypothetical protein